MASQLEEEPMTDMGGATIRVSIVPKWVTPRRALVTVVLSGVLIPVLTGLAVAIADRLTRSDTEEPPTAYLFDHLAIEPADYHALPLYWRQALTEIVYRESDGSDRLRELVGTLDMDRIRLLGRIAPYYVGRGHIARDGTRSSEHPIPGVEFHEFLALEEWGVLQDVSGGVRYTMYDDTILFGQGLALRVELHDAEPEPVNYPITKVTEVGTELFASIGGVRSDLRYFKWLADAIEESAGADRATVTLHALGVTLENGNFNSVVVDRSRIDDLPPASVR